jgi:hypothetical protein
MAKRPVFFSQPDGQPPVITRYVEFQWHPGLSVSQKQKSIASLHEAANAIPGAGKVLEVSSKSPDPLGVALSAFNLTFDVKSISSPVSVECAYQGSKVFEHGGPFIDMFHMSSLSAKRDARLFSSGRLVGFQFFNKCWELEPQTAFYDWLYINALYRRSDLAERASRYSAFTDIEFNPDKSINCQAYSIALFVSLMKSGHISDVLTSKDAFISYVTNSVVNNARQDDITQPRLF